MRGWDYQIRALTEEQLQLTIKNGMQCLGCQRTIAKAPVCYEVSYKYIPTRTSQFPATKRQWLCEKHAREVAEEHLLVLPEIQTSHRKSLP